MADEHPVGTSAPIVVMSVGALVTASVFVFRSYWVLALGLGIFLSAAIWAGAMRVGRDSPGHTAGSGPSSRDPAEREPGTVTG